MLQVACPWCGVRDETEFTCGGELAARPEDALAASGREWAGYLWFRGNREGLHAEVWRHTWGCRQWFVAERDTLTHRILATATVEEFRKRRGNGG